MKLVIVSGLSGSGKTVALRTLEDAGYYCIDNLPLGMLSELIDNMIDGMMVINRHNMIVDLNPSAQRIFNITENVIGSDLDDLFDQLQLEQLEPNDQQERHHIKLVNRDGVNRFYDIQTSPILGDLAETNRGPASVPGDHRLPDRVGQSPSFLRIVE